MWARRGRIANLLLNGNFALGTVGTTNATDWTYANMYGAEAGGVPICENRRGRSLPVTRVTPPGTSSVLFRLFFFWAVGGYSARDF
jgi:hypothetical protein